MHAIQRSRNVYRSVDQSVRLAGTRSFRLRAHRSDHRGDFSSISVRFSCSRYRGMVRSKWSIIRLRIGSIRWSGKFPRNPCRKLVHTCYRVFTTYLIGDKRLCNSADECKEKNWDSWSICTCCKRTAQLKNRNKKRIVSNVVLLSLHRRLKKLQ